MSTTKEDPKVKLSWFQRWVLPSVSENDLTRAMYETISQLIRDRDKAVKAAKNNGDQAFRLNALGFLEAMNRSGVTLDECTQQYERHFVKTNESQDTAPPEAPSVETGPVDSQPAKG